MEPSPGRCTDHQFQELEQIMSLVFLWVCKRASHSTVVFSVSGIVELYPNITSRKTRGLEALLFLANTALRRILWWTWIRCFFLLFTWSLVWWRISWRRCTKMVLPSNTCLLCSQVLVLLSSKRASLSDREVLKDTDFEELLNLKELRAWEAFKSVCSGFLGNTRVLDYQACIEKLLKSYEDMECRMSLKVHFLHSYLNFFPLWSSEWWAWRMISPRHYEDGEQLSRQSGDFCWMLLRDISEAKYIRSKKTHFWLSVVLWIV